MSSYSNSHRKKWDSHAILQLPHQPSKAARPSKTPNSKAEENYEHYLLRLQERNRYIQYSISHSIHMSFAVSYITRLLKQLRQKSSQQIELEKKEQGFALYLNGANFSQPRRTTANNHPPSTRRGRQDSHTSSTGSDSRKRTSKTAGTCMLLLYHCLQMFLQYVCCLTLICQTLSIPTIMNI